MSDKDDIVELMNKRSHVARLEKWARSRGYDDIFEDAGRLLASIDHMLRTLRAAERTVT